jgi:hypothetical protein
VRRESRILQPSECTSGRGTRRSGLPRIVPGTQGSVPRAWECLEDTASVGKLDKGREIRKRLPVRKNGTELSLGRRLRLRQREGAKPSCQESSDSLIYMSEPQVAQEDEMENNGGGMITKEGTMEVA